METSHSLDSFSASAAGMNIPGETPKQSQTQALSSIFAGCYGPEAIRSDASRRTTIRSAAAGAS
eukprot:2146387-Pleurochrysis_carterae.AAC.1